MPYTGRSVTNLVNAPKCGGRLVAFELIAFRTHRLTIVAKVPITAGCAGQAAKPGQQRNAVAGLPDLAAEGSASAFCG